MEEQKIAEDKMINVTLWMNDNMQRIPSGIDEKEKEVLAYISMAMTKMYLIGETSHRWSDSFRTMIKQAPQEFLAFIGER
jgi:hypothetical protein